MRGRDRRRKVAPALTVALCVQDNRTPLHRAASKGHLQVVSYLCEQAANLESTTEVRGFLPHRRVSVVSQRAAGITLVSVSLAVACRVAGCRDSSARGGDDRTAAGC